MSLPLVDPYGRPLATSDDGAYKLPSMRGGGGWSEATSISGAQTGQVYGVDRRLERRASRLAFFLNPLFEGITGLLSAYVVGDEFTYGTMDDPKAQAVLEEMWALNNYDQFADRMWLEYLIDGESAVVFDTEARPGEPAYMALIDVDRPFEIETDVLNRVSRLGLKLGNEDRVWEQGQFTWTANHALFGDPRGWPVLMTAVPACLSYIGLLNSRLRAQELLGRVNGIYHALYYPGTKDADKDFRAKTARYQKLPSDGSILGLAIDAKSGHKEEFKLTESPKNASDAAEDARLIRMLAATALNIPPHWLGDAEDTNRASSDNMNGPPLIAMKRRQSTFRSMNNGNFRCELVRRHGPDALYTVHYTEAAKSDPLTIRRRRKRVPASMLEAPWNLPRLDDDSLQEVIEKVRLLSEKGLASRQTQQELFGLDVALEAERMAKEQPKVQRITSNAPPKPPGKEGEDGELTQTEPAEEETDAGA